MKLKDGISLQDLWVMYQFYKAVGYSGQTIIQEELRKRIEDMWVKE